MNIIAADVGGTKTRLVYADVNEPRNVLYEARYLSAEFDEFEPLLSAFLHDSGSTGGQIDTLALALPGLVSDSSAQLTNLPWSIEKQSIMDNFGIRNVHFMNDFQASAIGTGYLLDKDRITLNPGGVQKNTTRVTVGAGTGLGVAWMQGEQDKVQAYATEGGHIDFAPVDESQVDLLQFLSQRYGHVSYERLLSGKGLVTLYEYFSGKQQDGISAEWVNGQSNSNEAADRALTMFVKIYGAYIGNIALLFKPYGGIFITGGIAAKIVKRMQAGVFIESYLNKGRMSALVEQIAVYLVTNERVGVLGAMSEAVKKHNG